MLTDTQTQTDPCSSPFNSLRSVTCHNLSGRKVYIFKHVSPEEHSVGGVTSSVLAFAPLLPQRGHVEHVLQGAGQDDASDWLLAHTTPPT